MKKNATMKAFVFLFVFSFFASTLTRAQAPYNHAIGIKAGGGISFSYKKFLTDNNNLEAQATIWNKAFRLSGLYEFNFYHFDKVEGLSLFAGPGMHIGFWKDEYQKEYDSKVEFGIDGIIGLDYKFRDLPLNASLDWQPSVTIAGQSGFSPSFGGIALRYTF